MKFSLRSDLGGYAAEAPALKAIDGVEIEHPFVLLCGPNGSGKSALLGMMRRSMGLRGARAGMIGGDSMRPLPMDAGSSDLARMAMDREIFQDSDGVPKSEPGILDVEALGWKGQRSWSFSSRSETELISSGSLGDDMHYQVNRLVDGARRSSHGQALKQAWDDALLWAAGLIHARDPYDLDDLPPGRATLASKLWGTERSAERWLLLDEPETAIDAEALATGLALLLETAEIGRLRVFCASHSFLFAAGMANHPKVQVLDLGQPSPWLKMQQRALTMAMMPGKISDVGAAMAKRMQQGVEQQIAAEKEQSKKEVRKALYRLSEKALDCLIDLHGTDQGEMEFDRDEGPPRQSVEALERRGLVDARLWGRRPSIRLTRLGKEAAAWLATQRSAEPVETPRP